MHLQFVDHHLEPGDDLPDSVRNAYGALNRLAQGTPILLDRRWRPVEPWRSYFRFVASTTGPKTLRNYGYDALRFASFLEERDTDVINASNEDLLAYRDRRLSGSKPISAATWRRETVVIRGVYSYLQQVGRIDHVPWITIGRSSPLSTPWTSTPDIRPLTQSQWCAFRDVGLGGLLPDGTLDRTWRGTSPLRSQAGAELAVTTGMRVAEFATLLSAEVPRGSGTQGASVVLEACAKYRKRRRIHVPASTLRLIDLYRATERRNTVLAAQESLQRRRADLLVVDEVDAGAGVVRARVDGRRRAWPLHQMPAELRSIAVEENSLGLEPLGLFVGRGGLPISLRAWHAHFQAASRRVRELAPDLMDGRRAQVTPHDLRHTFAVVMLKELTEVALARERDRRQGHLGPATLSEHISINPRLTVQRLLGHSNPATTMIYLRYIEDTESLIENVFAGWSDAGATYAQEILKERTALV